MLFQRDIVGSDGGDILKPEEDGAGDAGLESGGEGDDGTDDNGDGSSPVPGCRAFLWLLSPNSIECNALVQGVVELEVTGTSCRIP